MLHRVAPLQTTEFAPNRDMAVSPEFLEAFILGAKKNGHSFVSLDEMAKALGRGRGSKLIAMTFDDGYADNFTCAYPLLKKHDIPFTVYVTTAFPDGDAILWWYEIESLIQNNDTIRLMGGETLTCRTASEKLASFSRLREIILQSPAQNDEIELNRILGMHLIGWKQASHALTMSWKQITALAQDPLVDIGAHTISHARLSGLSVNDALHEIQGSRELIERQTGRTVKNFCYPFGARGDAGQREFDLVKTLGFNTATTTRWANIFPGHGKHLSALPRVALSNDFTWKEFQRKSFNRFLKGRMVTA
jgi:peptidoglycan/xylan/chitin deacetylase (PgdA/CDA1 family)